MGIAPCADSGSLIVDSLLGEAFEKVMQVRDVLSQLETLAPVSSQLALLAPYAEQIVTSGLKGDPGGNAMAIGPFTGANALNIPNGTDLVQTSGFRRAGKGHGLYAYDATIDEAYVIANPRTAFISANGRGFKLVSFYRSLSMFGCEQDGLADDAEPLQCFLNDAFNPKNAAAYCYDIGGDCAISRGVFAAYSSSPAQLRTFMGNLTLRSAPGAEIEYALTIAGYNQHWLGTVEFIGGNSGTAYLNRGIINGVRLFGTNGSRYAGFFGRAVQRHVALLDPKSTAETFQAGTPFQVTHAYSNNIGVTIDYIQGYHCGSNAFNELHSLKLGITSNIQEGPAGSFTQRSLLNVPDTGKLKVGDWGFTSIEKSPADYGTIGFDNATGTITRSAGSWADEGWLANDLVHFVSDTGPNRGFEFKVTAVGINTLTVTPKPVSAAAIAGTMFRSKPRLHRVEQVVSPTQFRVMPWVDSRIQAGTWRSCSGGVFSSQGPNTANVKVGTVYSVGGGIALHDGGLYGIQVGELLGEVGCISYMTGNTTGDAGIGRKLGKVHSEASFLDYVQVATGSGQSTVIEGASAWGVRPLPPGDNWQTGLFTRMLGYGPASNTTNGLPNGQMRNLTLDTGRIKLEALGDSWGGNNGTTVGITLTNRPNQRRRDQVVATNVTNATITLEFDASLAEISPNTNWAEVYWERQGGLAPGGVMTFQLVGWMVADGWTIAGGTVVGSTTSWTGPGTPLFFRIIFNAATKQVSIVPFSSGYYLNASAAYNPPALAAGAKTAIQTTAVSGAAFGDQVLASFTLDLAGASIRAWVSATGVVSWYFVNENGADGLDLGAGNVRFRIMK